MMGELVSQSLERRRISPRVEVESLCSELHGQDLRHGLVVDLSVDGLRIQRPVGGIIPRQVPIEFEIPEVDEVAWALGEVCFDAVRPSPCRQTLVRATGLHLVSMASRQRRLLREYVLDTFRRERHVGQDLLMNASCYLRG